jgi:DNA modification methylase
MYGYRPGAWFGDQTAKRCNVVVCDSYRHGIRDFEKADHPTQKWLPMIHRIVESIVPHGASALDPFMGSGTTGVACVRTGRRFIGIEKEPKYFTIAIDRIKKELDRYPLFQEEKQQVQGSLLTP